MHPELMNPLTLAYIGDAVFEVYVRKYLIASGLVKVNELQKASVRFVNKFAQAHFIVYCHDKDFLTEEEISLYKRGRNVKQRRMKDPIVHRQSTGFEAIIGHHYLLGNIQRLEEIFEYYKVYINEDKK